MILVALLNMLYLGMNFLHILVSLFVYFNATHRLSSMLVLLQISLFF